MKRRLSVSEVLASLEKLDSVSVVVVVVSVSVVSVIVEVTTRDKSRN